MKYQLRQVDMMNRDSLYYLERLDAFEIMETHIMDRVMQEYWQGNLDVAGSFFETSTAYGVLFKSRGGNFSKTQDNDYELQHRFYKGKDLDRIAPHILNFRVVLNSMQTRYFLEMVFYFMLVIAF